MQQLPRKDEKFMEISNWTANIFSCFWASYFALFEKWGGMQANNKGLWIMGILLRVCESRRRIQFRHAWYSINEWKIFSHFINIIFQTQLTHIEMYKSIVEEQMGLRYGGGWRESLRSQRNDTVRSLIFPFSRSFHEKKRKKECLTFRRKQKFAHTFFYYSIKSTLKLDSEEKKFIFVFAKNLSQRYEFLLSSSSKSRNSYCKDSNEQHENFMEF